MDGQSKFMALLIGIDHYFPNKLPNGSFFPNLEGCVRDITYVETFLKRQSGLKDDQIIKLTTTNREATELSEPNNQWPTYSNIVNAFQQLIAIVHEGDHIYIHYSGHGARARTLFPELKGEQGLDESLVPMDIGFPTAQYLRDIELAYLLHTLVRQGSFVTIVLDCCYSGGATRGMGNIGIRGLSTIDTTLRATHSLVASHENLIQTWNHLTQGTTRQATPSNGWLPNLKGYVLLAACRSTEKAYEYAFKGREKQGVLTYWWLDSLNQLGPDYTCKHLQDRLLAKIHSQFEQQTPQLLGEGSRIVFGNRQVQMPYAVTVMKVDAAGSRMVLNTGEAQGIRTGSQFAVYPSSTTNFADLANRLALVEITQAGATSSWATIVSSSSRPVEQGAQAVLVDPGSAHLRSRVLLVHQDGLPTSNPQHKALEAVKTAVAQSSFVEIAAEDIVPDYQVIVNAQGSYEIWDPAGTPVRNVRPALAVSDSDAATKLAQRLVHLTKYRNIQQIDNPDPFSPLAHKLIVELSGVETPYDPTVRPVPRPLNNAGNTPMLRPDEWILLRIKNAAHVVLNITVMDLQPGWGVKQLYPSEQGGYSEPLDPGHELPLLLRTFLPEGNTDAIDILKVFATVGSANFRWLELPALDQPPPRIATRGRPITRLEELLIALAVEGPKTRHVSAVSYVPGEWITAQVEVYVKQF